MGITQIDWGNAGFIRTYTMAFGASVVLTVVLWLVAVAKRAIQGVNPVQALGESIGYLLLSVMTSAFAPLGIAYVTQIFDGIAEAMLWPVTQDLPKIGTVLGGMLIVLLVLPGGPLIVLAVGFFLLMAVLGVWLEIIVRNALIYTGLVFGPTVFAGLVDKDLWGHTKRWFGIVVGIIASEYVTFTTLALASSLLAGKSSENASVAQAFGTCLTAVALFFLALYLPFQVAKFIPILGDQLQDVFSSRKQMEGGLSNVAQSAKSSFGDIKSKLSSGSDGNDGDDGGSEGGAEIGAAAAGGGAAPGIGLAKAAQERGQQEVKAAAMRGVDGATAATEQADDPSNGTSTAGGTAGAPDQSQGVDDQTHDSEAQAPPGSADMANGADSHQGAAEGTAASGGGPVNGSAPSLDGSAASGGSAPRPGGYGEGAAPAAPAEAGLHGSATASTAAAPSDTFSDGSPVEEPPDEGE
ncbi:hypothetical protein ACFU7Y_20535 [Kitasatospora sp. NPDC057542]|uniref:hypothetical protein n=1 Tax=Kitasatospora sp. NPDC057542 TaxID=3346162 RepID=UPI0036A8DF22